MKKWIFLFLTILATLNLKAQNLLGEYSDIHAYSDTDDYIIQAYSNALKIKEKAAGKMNVSVSSGSIGKGTRTSIKVVDRQMTRSVDTLYYWHMCKKGTERENLYIEYVSQDSLIRSDTLSFQVINPPKPVLALKNPLSDTLIRDSLVQHSTDSDSITPKNIVGINMNGFNYEFNYGIETFDIEIRQNDSTVQTFTNADFLLSKQNKQTLRAYNDGYIIIKNVDAHFSCGVKVPFRESKPIFYR